VPEQRPRAKQPRVTCYLCKRRRLPGCFLNNRAVCIPCTKSLEKAARIELEGEHK
jgi:hypothetical protein